MVTHYQRVTNRCRPSWLTNCALVYEPKCGGRGELRGSQLSANAYICTQELKLTLEI
jgi:hypothetical protein